jgi:hypothetical protein
MWTDISVTIFSLPDHKYHSFAFISDQKYKIFTFRSDIHGHSDTTNKNSKTIDTKPNIGSISTRDEESSNADTTLTSGCAGFVGAGHLGFESFCASTGRGHRPGDTGRV